MTDSGNTTSKFHVPLFEPSPCRPMVRGFLALERRPEVSLEAFAAGLLEGPLDGAENPREELNLADATTERQVWVAIGRLVSRTPEGRERQFRLPEGLTLGRWIFSLPSLRHALRVMQHVHTANQQAVSALQRLNHLCEPRGALDVTRAAREAATRFIFEVLQSPEYHYVRPNIFASGSIVGGSGILIEFPTVFGYIGVWHGRDGRQDPLVVPPIIRALQGYCGPRPSIDGNEFVRWLIHVSLITGNPVRSKDIDKWAPEAPRPEM